MLFQVARVGKALSAEFTKDSFVLLRCLHLRGLHPVGLGAVLLQSVIRLAGEVAVALLADHLVPGEVEVTYLYRTTLCQVSSCFLHFASDSK